MDAPRRLALATCAEFPGGEDADRPLVDAFARAGIAATWTVWDDPAVDWRSFDAVLLRSTWDYQHRREQFLSWARSVPRLLNPLDVVAWNTDKRYLAELADTGVPVVDTAFLPPGEAFAAPPGPYVVKPSVSAGSRDTARFAGGDGDAARAGALVGAIHASGRTVMVQPYVASVDERGETALVHFDGAYSHAASKGPILAAGAEPTTAVFAAETIAAREPSDGERTVARRALTVVAGRFGTPPVYARVDVVLGGKGEPLVLELELTEPSLFFDVCPQAVDALVAAVATRLPLR